MGGILRPVTETAKGFRAYPRGVSWLWQHKKYLALLFIPLTIGLMVLIGGWGWLYAYQDTLMEWALFPKPESFGMLTIYYLLWAMLNIAFIILSFLVCLLVTNVIAAPIYEVVSMAVERDVTGEDVHELSLKDSFKLIKEELKKVAFILGISMLLLFIPGINVISIFITALLVGWDFYDYPLARQGWSFNKRLRFVVNNMWAVMAFGLWLMIPFVQVVLMPLAIAGGTLLNLENAKRISKRPERQELRGVKV